MVSVLELVKIEDVTPKEEFIEEEEDREAIHQARTRRERFRFDSVGIPIGAELIFSRDESKVARVINSREIEFNGKPTSLSSSASDILGYNYPVAGTFYWKYEGEILNELRNRIEGEELEGSELDGDLWVQQQVDITRGK